VPHPIGSLKEFPEKVSLYEKFRLLFIALIHLCCRAFFLEFYFFFDAFLAVLFFFAAFFLGAVEVPLLFSAAFLSR